MIPDEDPPILWHRKWIAKGEGAQTFTLPKDDELEEPCKEDIVQEMRDLKKKFVRWRIYLGQINTLKKKVKVLEEKVQQFEQAQDAYIRKMMMMSTTEVMVEER